MNIPEFEHALLKHYDKHHGPFNWLASEYDLGVYNYLSFDERKKASALIYAKYADTVSNISEQTLPIEKILLRPAKFQEFFELIICCTLMNFIRENNGGTRFCIGDCPLPKNRDDLFRLKEQFEILKSSFSTANDQWFANLKDVWGSSAFISWIDFQIAFLNGKLKTNPGHARPDKTQKNNWAPEEPRVDPLSVASCEIIDYSDLSIEEAQARLEKMIGTEVKRKILSLIAASVYGEARAIPQPALFNNFILSGPPGVGKTTSAKLLAGLLAASGLVKNKIALHTTTSALIGTYIGTTEAKIRNLFDRGQGGVIIIDEADALASRDAMNMTKYQEGAIDTLNALIGYEKDNNNGTVVILTGYEFGIQNLLDRNQGLRRRFPHHITIPAYDIHALRGVLMQMLDARAYKYEPAVIESALQEILAAKDFMGAAFGNAGTVEEFIGVMEAGRAQRIGLAKLHQIIADKTTRADAMAQLSELSNIDIPMFDKNAKIFRTRTLSLVQLTDDKL